MAAMVSQSLSIMSPEDITSNFESLSMSPYLDDNDEERGKSLTIIDSNENFLASDIESFRKQLGLHHIDQKLKVIAIFGNSGDGKSHTLNSVFFDGAEVFKMSPEQNSCTIGVSCFYQQFFYNHEILCIDTEGLQGAQNDNRQQRLLLKVLAIADLIIYRTRAERLNNDMYKFLATASKTFQKHFAKLLEAPVLHENSSSATAKGPDVIIFHETRNTMPLNSSLAVDSPERAIKEKFADMKLSIEAFRSIHYIGVQTSSPPTDFSKLKLKLKMKIEDIGSDRVRTFRNIYESLVLLNEKFSGALDGANNLLHELHFTCDVICEGCNQRCDKTKDHTKEDIEHRNDAACQYHQTLNNKIFLCRKCHLNNRRSVVTVNDSIGESSWAGIAKYAWSLGGAQIQKLDCATCGEIYRAKWYGNKSPEETCVLAEAVHCWSDGYSRNQAATHSAQAILDGFSYITDTISDIGAQPTKTISSWVADNIVNPAYWRPNSEIVSCKACRINFQRNGLKIHHCRNCGEGFCSNCSRSRMAVPMRGWGSELVRVCDACRDKKENGNSDFHSESSEEKAKEVRVRKYGEVLANCVSSVASALEIPKEMIKDSVRPDYWAKDCDSPSCAACKQEFGDVDEMNQAELFYREPSTTPNASAQSSPVKNVIDIRRHHCRDCGLAVCNKCSLNRKPVKERGWNTSVRVCDSCFEKKDC